MTTSGNFNHHSKTTFLLLSKLLLLHLYHLFPCAKNWLGILHDTSGIKKNEYLMDKKNDTSGIKKMTTSGIKK